MQIKFSIRINTKLQRDIVKELKSITPVVSGHSALRSTDMLTSFSRQLHTDAISQMA